MIDEATKKLVQQKRAISNAIQKADPQELAIKLGLNSEFRGKPFPHQYTGAAFAYAMESSLIADSVGLGKTVEALMLVAKVRRAADARASHPTIDYEPGPIVIFCPGKLVNQWVDECQHFLGEKPVVLRGLAKRRNFIIAKRPTFMLMNYEMFVRYPNIFDDLPDPELVVMDEASHLRSHDAKTKAAVQQYTWRARYRLALTATPIETELANIHSILEVLHIPGLLKWPLFKRAFVRTQRIDGNRFGKRFVFEKVIGYQNLPQALSLISPFILRRTAKDAGVHMPKVVLRDETFEFERDHLVYYLGLKHAALQAAEKKDSTDKNTTRHDLEKASNFYVHPSGKVFSPKMDRIIEYLRGDLRLSKLVIYAFHLPTLALIATRLRQEKITHAVLRGDVDRDERSLIQRNFNESPDPQVLIVNDVAKEGLNLPATEHMFFFDTPLNPAKLEQIIGRGTRLTSTQDSIIATVMMMADSHESNLFERLEMREALRRYMLNDSESIIFGPVTHDMMLAALQ